MQCVVLGASGSQPGNGQACSGYLVQTSTTSILVDCGFGVAAALSAVSHPTQLDAVFLTHRHLDHCADVLGLFSMLRRVDTSLPVHAAAEVDETLTAAVSRLRRDVWRQRLPMHPLAPRDEVVVGDLTVTAHAADHAVPTVSLRIADTLGHVLAYSSDTGGGADLQACLQDADVALVEATWQEADTDRNGDGHMCATQAAQAATAADVRHLVLTHVRPHLDPVVSRQEAAEYFSGPIAVAEGGIAFDVPIGNGGARRMFTTAGIQA